MKARRVVLTVEVETDLTLRRLRDWVAYMSANGSGNGNHYLRYIKSSPDGVMDAMVDVLQISANVIREKKRKGER